MLSDERTLGTVSVISTWTNVLLRRIMNTVAAACHRFAYFVLLSSLLGERLIGAERRDRCR